MDATIARVALLSACALFGARAASAQSIAPYFESSANQKPRGDAGVSVTSDRVKLNADVALRAPDGDTRIIPQLSSAFALTSRLGLETKVRFDDWNHAELPGPNVDTSLRFQPGAPVFKELEGRVWRSPDGQSGRMLKFGFFQKLGDQTEQTPLTLRSNASFESTVGAPDGSLDPLLEPRPESRRVRLETEVGGLLPRMPGRSAIKIKLVKAAGAAPGTTSSVTYNHSWRVGPADLGLNFKMTNTSVASASSFDPSFSLDWKWRQ